MANQDSVQIAPAEGKLGVLIPGMGAVTTTFISRSVPSAMNIRATSSYGSFNTRMLALDFDSGQFGGANKKSTLVINLHQMLSDGYQTFNYQKRVAGFLKYQYRLSDRTTFTVFGGLVDLWTNTPNTKGPTRAQVAQFGDNYLLSDDPSQPNYGSEQETVKAYPFIEFGFEPVPVAALESGRSSRGPQCFRTVERC